MYESADTIVSAYLDPGEPLLWSGQPRQGLLIQPQDAYLIPFSLFWGGFALCWEAAALYGVTKASSHTGPAIYIFPLFGLPFVFMGLYLIIGRFFADARLRRRTFYGVTNERILIVSGHFSPTIKSLALRTLTDVSLSQRPDGSGSITFGPTGFMNGLFPSGGSWPTTSRRYAPPAFNLIPDAKTAYDIIRQAQKAA